MTVTSRPAAPDDAILGRLPEVVYEPATPEEAAQCVSESARAGRALVFVGGGTDLEAGAAPERLGAVVRTGGLSRVREHAPADQIVVVEAGCTLASLQAALAASRQRLALDPPLPERATIGGIVAANAFGPRRARFGSVRDLLIGASFVRADGVSARGGSKVVKNVAGFDVPKLLVGSMGTLALITTATFRLHPLPEEEKTMFLPGRCAADVRALVGELRKAQLEPTSVVAAWRGADRFDVAVRLEGFAACLAEERDRLEKLLRTESAACDALSGPEAADFWRRHDELRSRPPVRARLSVRVTDFETIAARVLPAAAASFEEPGFLVYPTLGLAFFSGRPGEPAAAAEALRSARSAIAKLGGGLTLSAAPPEIRDRLDVWGTAPPGLALMRSVKARLDPKRLLAPGRFVGGI